MDNNTNNNVENKVDSNIENLDDFREKKREEMASATADALMRAWGRCDTEYNDKYSDGELLDKFFENEEIIKKNETKLKWDLRTGKI